MSPVVRLRGTNSLVGVKLKSRKEALSTGLGAKTDAASVRGVVLEQDMCSSAKSCADRNRELDGCPDGEQWN